MAQPLGGLVGIEFDQCLAGPYVFRVVKGDGVIATLVIHVDNIIADGDELRSGGFGYAVSTMIAVFRTAI